MRTFKCVAGKLDERRTNDDESPMLLKDRKGKGKGKGPSSKPKERPSIKPKERPSINPKEMPIGRAAKHDDKHDDTNNKYHQETSMKTTFKE